MSIFTLSLFRLGRKKCPHVDTVTKQSCEGGAGCGLAETEAESMCCTDELMTNHEDIKCVLSSSSLQHVDPGAGDPGAVRRDGLEQLVALQPELRQRHPREDQALQGRQGGAAGSR